MPQQVPYTTLLPTQINAQIKHTTQPKEKLQYDIRSPPSSQKSLESRHQSFMPAIISTNTTVNDDDDDDNDANSTRSKGVEFRMRRQSDCGGQPEIPPVTSSIRGSIKHRIRGSTFPLLLPPVYNVRPPMLMVMVVVDNRYFHFPFASPHATRIQYTYIFSVGRSARTFLQFWLRFTFAILLDSIDNNIER